MSEIRFIKVKIRDLFVPKGGSNKYTKEFIANNPGEYPIYSSNTIKMFGKCNESQYNGEFLTWSLVGCAGYILKLNGQFCITNNRGILIPKEDINNLDLDYIKYLIEPLFRKYKTGREGDLGKNEYTKLSPNAINKIEDEISIPVDEQGNYDINAQKQLSKRFSDIERQKKCLLNKIVTLSSIQVVVPKNEKILFKNIKCSFLFTPTNGCSIYTKEYCKNHQGTIPLYSGNTEDIFDKIDTYDYNGEYLTWAKDGLAGYMMLHNGKFSITGHRGILIPTDKCKNVNLKYIKYVLEPLFRANKKGREGDLGKNEYTTLNSDMIKKMKDTIPIPIKEDGSFDLDKQKELASKYEQIDEIKTGLINKILELTDIVIS